ncbi:MAG: hypothetical protein H7A55_19235 [Verrucomicrobiaceae bacterium]|nr:hypothetical protein [Verrucomicrobiaceae bacterium]
MTKLPHLKLIDGTFTPTEAGRVLLSLVKSKIDYHSLERLSNEERFGSDHSHSEKRIQELEELNRELKELLKTAANTNHNLKVNGWFEITPV